MKRPDAPMGEVVNLRQARKRKRRGDAEKVAAENRRAHGRSASEKAAVARLQSLDLKRLDAHRRETPVEDGEER